MSKSNLATHGEVIGHNQVKFISGIQNWLNIQISI